VSSKPLNEVWDNLDFAVKMDLTRGAADWNNQLSSLCFKTIGSIYMRIRRSTLELFIGPAIHTRLYEGGRILHPVNRGPFESLQADYDAMLDLTQRYVNESRQKASTALREAARSEYIAERECSLSTKTPHCDAGRIPPETDSSSQLLSAEESLLAQADIDDARDESRWGVSRTHLSFLPGDLFVYRDLIAKLCPLQTVNEPLVTRLAHPDISMSNIFVTDGGSLGSLIDWERARVEPDILNPGVPEFLIGDDAFEAPPETQSRYGSGNSNVITEEDLRDLRSDEMSYRYAMDLIEKTKLREVYKQELQRLRSPLSEIFIRDHRSLEQQLMERVLWPHDFGGKWAFEWAVDHLGEAAVMGEEEERMR